MDCDVIVVVKLNHRVYTEGLALVSAPTPGWKMKLSSPEPIDTGTVFFTVVTGFCRAGALAS
jgi:hypothetical protein